MEKYPSEIFEYIDKDTGVRIKRLTSYMANSNHLYFTNNCFYDGGKKLVFESDRGCALNLFSLDLLSGEIEQLTDLARLPYPEEYALLEAFVDAKRNLCCFFAASELYILDLKTKRCVPVYKIPEGYFHHISSISADGRYVYTSIYESRGSHVGERALADIMKQNPRSKILKIATDGKGYETIFEENAFIAHVNASPTDPDVLTFCHEGPWRLVDHRLWILDTRHPVPRKLRLCREDECIGHEYWYASGDRIGYHGYIGETPMLGSLKTDGSDDGHYEFPYNTGHIFSQDDKLIIGDGNRDGKYIRLWRLLDTGYESPRALCLHNSSFKRQRAHVHPRLTDDGKAVLYTSDETGYEQLYLAYLPDDLSELPMLDKLSKK